MYQSPNPRRTFRTICKGNKGACFSVAFIPAYPYYYWQPKLYTYLGRYNSSGYLYEMVVYGLYHDSHFVIDGDVCSSHCRQRTKERALKSYRPGRINPRLAQFVKLVDFLPEEVFLGICSGGLPSGPPNPDTILDQ